MAGGREVFTEAAGVGGGGGKGGGVSAHECVNYTGSFTDVGDAVATSARAWASF